MSQTLHPFELSVVITGFFTSLGLIMAIGAQNAFVLRQGIRRSNILPVVIACAGSDAILISTGVFAFEQIEKVLPSILPIAKYGGAVFLIAYGVIAFRAAWIGGEHLDPASAVQQSAKSALITCLMLTWLNPHVYLDTVVLLGSISTQYDGARYGFALGAALASFAFFLALGYGARFLAPLFAKPKSWRLLECFIGITMWIIALKLLFGS